MSTDDIVCQQKFQTLISQDLLKYSCVGKLHKILYFHESKDYLLFEVSQDHRTITYDFTIFEKWTVNRIIIMMFLILDHFTHFSNMSQIDQSSQRSESTPSKLWKNIKNFIVKDKVFISELKNISFSYQSNTLHLNLHRRVKEVITVSE